MTDNDDRSWVLKASSERAKEAQDRERIQETANAIAERRGRDLVDFLSVIEQSEGWLAALDCLRRASKEEYQVPMRSAGYRAPLEPLKYREMVFEFFSCTGFEPVDYDTMSLLNELEDEESSVSATSRFSLRVEELAAEQLASGDALFFDFSNTRSPQVMLLLEKTRQNEARVISALVNGSRPDLRRLWLTEAGRLLLSEVGVKGLDANVFGGDVMFVIHTLQTISETEGEGAPRPDSAAPEREKPLNGFYKRLLESIASQNDEVLCTLGSRHSVATLNVLLCDSLASYQTTDSSESYRRLVRNIGNHVMVRAYDSVSTLGKLARIEDSRVSMSAIIALGSFYHESAASVLVDLVCEAPSKESAGTSLSALLSIAKRCPEARKIIAQVLHSDRPNRGRFRKLYREMPHGLPDWYHLE